MSTLGQFLTKYDVVIYILGGHVVDVWLQQMLMPFPFWLRIPKWVKGSGIFATKGEGLDKLVHTHTPTHPPTPTHTRTGQATC